MGTLHVVATPIGNLEDITLRALRVLREAAVIAAEDTRRTGKLLAHAGITTPMLSLHAHNETGRVPQVLARLHQGEDVALVTDAGTPLVSDPGEQLIQSALATGLKVEPVPGASAVLAALTMAGIPASRFTFLGFPPVKISARRRWCLEVTTYDHPVVFFEAPHRIRQTLEMLAEVGGPARRVALCREITKRHEELVHGAVGDLVSYPAVLSPRGEFTCVVEAAAADGPAGRADDAQLTAEFYRMTTIDGLERRDALNTVARRYRVRTRDVFAAVARTKDARADED